MNDVLERLEKDLLTKNRELQEKAEKTLIDATTIISGTETSRKKLDSEFLEQSLKEVFDKAKEDPKQLAFESKEHAAVPDDCEILNNSNVTIRLQRAKLNELETNLKAAKDSLREQEKKEREMENTVKELKVTISKHNEKTKKQQVELQKLKTEKEKAEHGMESAKVEVRELKSLLSEQEKETRKLASTTKTKEVRQKRVEEELSRCKSSMETLKQTEKESRNHARKDYDKLVEENSKLERQKSELLVALRKQFKLIDILKRQKAHLEVAKVLSFTEDEFIKTI